jgi:hypothetical protein
VLYEYGGQDALRVRALHEAYVAAGGPGRVDRPGRFSMAIAQLGHIGERACERSLDPATSEVERARAAALLGEFLTDRPLTRALIEELLAAVA